MKADIHRNQIYSSYMEILSHFVSVRTNCPQYMKEFVAMPNPLSTRSTSCPLEWSMPEFCPWPCPWKPRNPRASDFSRHLPPSRPRSNLVKRDLRRLVAGAVLRLFLLQNPEPPLDATEPKNFQPAMLETVKCILTAGNQRELNTQFEV